MLKSNFLHGFITNMIIQYIKNENLNNKIYKILKVV